MNHIKEIIAEGKTFLGIEFGSTRIKAILIDEKYAPIASGSYEWENQLIDGIWTYHLEAIWKGLQECYMSLAQEVHKQYGIYLEKVAAIGISGMMHGYMAFDKEGELLVPFRTWRNTITKDAASELTKVFDFNIPQRWSIAHLYQAILNKEPHVGKIDYITTLAGYIHWKLTGEKVLGIGEASGMFPIDSEKKQYNSKMMEQFQELEQVRDFEWKLEDILPKVMMAGQLGGVLTEEGAKLLDISGKLSSGIPLAPPEGDAGTGMTATNSVAPRTGNVSAGTSIFAMVVLEKELQKVYEELDMVTTPSGDAVAMVHGNNCTSDLNAWVGLFREFSELLENRTNVNEIYQKLYINSLNGEKDAGGLLAFNCYSGEPIIGLDAGMPLFMHGPNTQMNLANFIRAHLYAALAVLKMGCDILFKQENVKVDTVYGHGGFFKTEGVGQSILADALNVPVAVMKTAGEGGPWGMALLAAFMIEKQETETLEHFLEKRVFVTDTKKLMLPDLDGVQGFDRYMERYKQAIAVEKMASGLFTRGDKSC